MNWRAFVLRASTVWCFVVAVGIVVLNLLAFSSDNEIIGSLSWWLLVFAIMFVPCIALYTLFWIFAGLFD